MKKSQFHISTILVVLILMLCSCNNKSQDDIKKIESWDRLFGKNTFSTHKALSPSNVNRPTPYAYIKRCMDEYSSLYQHPQVAFINQIEAAYTENIGFSNTTTDGIDNLGIPLATWISEHSDSTKYSEIRVCFGIYVAPKDSDKLDPAIVNHILNGRRKNGNPIKGSLTVFLVATKKTTDAGIKGGPDDTGFNLGDMFP